ncbi:MAG TPA: tRNA 2-thiocytidine biosynthesis protein TtcA [Clostridiales bacterium]|nr:tRNA 2-thiocytidine biosynthesis protein TtcA [Clostridiales bacterium]
MKKVLGCLRRAIEDFDMIQDGDKIAVGVSGGKDSLMLLNALNLYRYFSPVEFELYGIMLTLGFDNIDTSNIEKFCAEINVPLIIKHTLIGKIVFEERQEKNPCSLCARMRRGALHNAAIEIGCEKVALGHHREDVIETFFLSLFYEGRINTFSPVTYLDRKNITLIRPLIYTPESEIKAAAKRINLPILQNPCPASGKTKRQEMKELMDYITNIIPNAREQVLTALINKEQYNLWN